MVTVAKDKRERIVFEKFANSSRLFETGATIESRHPPEPDILFTQASGRQRSFELVEILDRDYSSSLGRQLDTKQICYEHLEAMEPSSRTEFKLRFADADIFLSFRNSLTPRRRKNALPTIFRELLSLPPGVTGTVFNEGGSLEKILKYATIHRGCFIGPMFDAPSVVRVGNPTVEAIHSKMTKTYKTSHELSLLAYIETNPMFPDDVWLPDLDEYLADLDGSCQFANIYVYDCYSGQVKRSWQRDS
jgi:hypothetical protein